LARFRPFRGIRYSASRVGALDPIVTPPYDVISPDARDRLIAGSPYNVARLILNPEGHGEAAAQYRRWLDEGVLAWEDRPAFYLYSQDFESDGPRRRVGVIGALHLEPFSTGVVRRHERTFAHHKRDRLELTQQVRANLSPIFGLFSNPSFAPSPERGWDTPADIDVVHEGVRSRVWVLRDPVALRAVTEAVDERTVFIADGHHRYETALAYHETLHGASSLPTGRDAPEDAAAPDAHVLAFLGAFEDPGMVILPTHREIVRAGGASLDAFTREIEKRFRVEKVERGAGGGETALAKMATISYDENAFVLALSGRGEYWILRRPAAPSSAGTLTDALDVGVLHSVLLGDALHAAGGKDPEIAYSPDPGPLFARVAAGRSEAAFFMRPMLARQMEAACLAGELLPQKSTYFYPKLLTGLVFHSLERAGN
jgi:uncharacterized protein (DUF1015 family)